MPQFRQRNQGSPNSGAPMGAVGDFGGRSAQDPIARVTWLLTRRAARGAGARAGSRRPLGGTAPRASLEPPRAARPTFAVVVLADHLGAVAVKDHHLRATPPTLPARLVERVGRESGGVDGRARHGAPSQLRRRPRASCRPGHGAADQFVVHLRGHVLRQLRGALARTLAGTQGSTRTRRPQKSRVLRDVATCTGRGILCAWRIGRPNLRRGARHRTVPDRCDEGLFRKSLQNTPHLGRSQSFRLLRNKAAGRSQWAGIFAS